MKDFAKSIRTGNEYKPGSYDPKRHEINLWKLDNEIEKWSRTVSTLKQQIAGLERMVSSGEYSKLTNEELKRAKRDQEAAYMRLKQALSMKKRATGNASFKDVIWTVEDEDGSGSDFQSEAIAYATARKWARESGEPVNIFKTELDENGRPKGQPKFVKTVNKSKVGNEATVLKDGNVWVVLYANETKSQEFETEEEAREFAKKVGNSKVGNEDNSDIIRAAKKQLEDAKKFGWSETGYNGWTKKDVEDLEKKIKELEQKQKTGNSSHTKEEAKTKDEYFKILKFYQIQGYKTKSGEYNPNGRIKLHKGDDSVEIVLVGNSKVGNADTYERLNEAIKTARAYSYNAYTRMASPFSSISIINDLSKCKEACDEAIKLVKQYDKERYN